MRHKLCVFLSIAGLCAVFWLATIAPVGLAQDTVAPPPAPAIPDSSNNNFGWIAAALAALTALLGTLYQGRNNSLTLQYTQLSVQQKRLDEQTEQIQQSLQERAEKSEQMVEKHRQAELELKTTIGVLTAEVEQHRRQLDQISREKVELALQNQNLVAEVAALKTQVQVLSAKQNS